MSDAFVVTRKLPMSGLEVEVGPLTFGQVLRIQHQTTASERPPYLDDDQWGTINLIAGRVRRLGKQVGVTAEQLLEMLDADVSAIQDAIAEGRKLEARFRPGSPEPAVGDGSGGEGDGVAAGGAGGDA